MTTDAPPPTAFKAHPADNVATLLDDASNQVQVLDTEGGNVDIEINEEIHHGHKIALRAIQPGEEILKYGIPIGVASRTIAAGDWVHLQNCASKFDERSSTLDLHSGAPTDTQYA